MNTCLYSFCVIDKIYLNTDNFEHIKGGFRPHQKKLK